MRVFRLAHQLVQRFSAMDESEADSLNSEAENAYNAALYAAKAKEISNAEKTAENAKHSGESDYKPLVLAKLTISDRLVLFAEKWYSRYGFAILYIILVPQIRRYMEEGSEDEDEEGGSMGEMVAMLSALEKYKKFKKQ
jgi:hypothetical protein